MSFLRRCINKAVALNFLILGFTLWYFWSKEKYFQSKANIFVLNFLFYFILFFYIYSFIYFWDFYSTPMIQNSKSFRSLHIITFLRLFHLNNRMGLVYLLHNKLTTYYLWTTHTMIKTLYLKHSKTSLRF